MSVYKKANRPFYYYDFEIRNSRFAGSTKCKTRREAELFERERRKEAEAEVSTREKLGREPMTFALAASRYWQEVGQFAKSQNDIWRTLGWLQREVGDTKRVVAIDDALVIRLKTTRRQEKNQRGETVSAATVNRTLEILRTILLRAARLWQEPTAPVDWRRHMMSEPQERVRELKGDEEEAMFAALRPDYHAIVRFALMTGCRLNECVSLRWKDVDWGARQLWIFGKGDKLAPVPLPPSVRALLWPLQGEHPEFVFTYIADRARDGRRAGQRYPITYEGLKTAFRRDVKPVVAGYRFHDNRHTAATRVLRASGNLKVAQRMLRHADIATTSKYAHVMHEDVLEAMETAAKMAPVTAKPDIIPDVPALKRQK
ncbi:site-specific integrase [Methylobacterium sp. WL7]|uniref:tyrosine-type recombinase/integrase n=1 Tax=Methylobacterium sp. WL7 TaxID=2603900 RepID=UPI0011CB92B8|nr:site-specific integrase [Methylobacterium sp. WL7]TXN43861.1 site-specific integrase [Methylobacterium sp. WL7]